MKGRGLPGWWAGVLLGMACSIAAADTTLQVCPASQAPSGLAQTDFLQPDGEALRAVVTRASAHARCVAMPLGPIHGNVLAIRPVSESVAALLDKGLTLSGTPHADRFSISDLTPHAGSEALPPTPPLPYSRNLLPLLQVRVFGAEARATLPPAGEGVVLQCTPGSQPAGLVLSAERPLPGSPALLQMQVRGAGLFQLHAVNADEAARQSGTMLGEIHPGDSRPLHRYPLPRTAPGAHAWSHWTIACPPSSAQLVLQNLQLQPAAAGPVPARSAWVWQPGAWRDTPDTVLARAQRHGIQTLFITVPLAAGAVQDPASLGRFIAQARAADVAVWAVDGDPRMVLPREHAIAAARARAFAQYNRQAAPQARLAGVQFDVEPYLLPGYDLATEQWERHYVALVAALQDAAGGLPLDMVVPFWWGSHATLRDAMASHVNSLTVMNYRTDPAEIVRFAQPWLEWGSRWGKTVRVALEAGPIAPETQRRYTPQATGELWLLALQGQHFLVLLANAAPNPHGPAFRASGSRLLTGDATTFHAQPQRLLELLPALEAQFSAWPEFAGMALHEIR
ncbi:MAG TPA: hypothetical protein VGE70_11765 [Burkholderiaceae bacterium]